MRNTSKTGTSGTQVDVEARELRRLIAGFSRRRSLRDPIAGMCEQAQLTPPQIHALLWLGEEGPLTMGELARRLGITEKTITGLVDRLELEGYVGRERDQADRRVVRARLTEKGSEVHRELDAHIHEKLAFLLGLLDPADRKALFRILQKLVQRLDDAADPAAPETRKP
jgi:DNA-binding MarR family transcriptional regulator